MPPVRGSGDPDTRNATDAVPAHVGGSPQSGPPECPRRTPTRDCWSAHRESRCAAVPGGDQGVRPGATARLSVQPDMLAIRVFLVDAHEVTRRGVTTVLAADPHIRVVGEAESMDQARRRALAVRPDVAVVDGAPLCADLRSVLPGMRCLVLGQDVGPEAVSAAIQGGASGYLVKDAHSAELVAAVRRVASGHILFAAATIALSERSYQQSPPEPAGAADRTGPPAAAARGRSQQPRDRRAPRLGGQDGEELRQHPAGEAEPDQSHPGGGPRHRVAHRRWATCPGRFGPLARIQPRSAAGSRPQQQVDVLSSSSLGSREPRRCDSPSVLVLVHDLHSPRAQHQRTTTQRPDL